MSSITIIQNPSEYFLKSVQSTINSFSIAISKETEFYIVNLLTRFTHPEQLYSIDMNGKFKNEPLAFLLKEAMEESVTDHKRLLFRNIGDISLHTVGVFPTVKVSSCYYQMMGKMAYNRVSQLYGNHHLKDMYRELATDFEKIAFILQKISNPLKNK